MKKIISSLVAFSFLLAVKAQEIPERKMDAPAHPMHEGRGGKEGMDRHHDMAFKNLNLSDEQKEKIKTERENMQKKMVDLKSNEDITVKEWKSRQEKIHQEFK